MDPDRWTGRSTGRSSGRSAGGADRRARADRGALAGSAIAGIFGAGWALWGASGLTGAAAYAVGLAGVVLGLGVVVRAMMLNRAPRPHSSAPSPGSMFSSGRYLLVVVLEFLAIAGGNGVLRASGRGVYVIAWIAAVVGAHFLVLGRIFYAGFLWLGAALIAAGGAGAVAGLAGGGGDAVTATCGLICASSMFGAATPPLR